MSDVTKVGPFNWLVADEDAGEYLFCEALGGPDPANNILQVEERWDGPLIRVSPENARLLANVTEVVDALEDMLGLLVWASGAFDTDEKSEYWRNAKGSDRIRAAMTAYGKAIGKAQS